MFWSVPQIDCRGRLDSGSSAFEEWRPCRAGPHCARANRPPIGARLSASQARFSSFQRRSPFCDRCSRAAADATIGLDAASGPYGHKSRWHADTRLYS